MRPKILMEKTAFQSGKFGKADEVDETACDVC